jgi:ubiquinone/menaquinone biosynthesis C-methylase UbiE
MAAEYDAIAQDYQRTKDTPLRRHVESWSFFRMLGDVTGQTILDLACGEGFYTRLLKQAGAAAVTGVDISPMMIALAEKLEVETPLGIDYHCSDVAELPDMGRFDLVTAAYLLHYAPDVQTLRAMCVRIAAQLRPGGRLVAINENPEQAENNYTGYTQYGFNKSLQGPRVDGAPINYALVSGRKLIRFSAYYYARSTYETALRAAGFTEMRWLPLTLAPAGIDELGADYWQEYLRNPPVTGLECRL